jgi:tetratricopeptide (TPR) repeat protein
MIRRTLLLAFVSWFTLHTAVDATSSQRGAATLEAWRAAVENHRAGVLDQSVKTVSVWTKAELEDVLDAFKKSDRTNRDAWLRRAILLHTDVLVLLRQPIGYSLPASGDRSVGLVADGVQLGIQRGTVHWEFVRRLVEDLDDADAARLWFRATTAFLESWLDWPESSTHLAQGRKRFPDDPVLLLYEATIHETFASPAIQTLEPPKDLLTPEPVHFATGSVFSLMNLQRPTQAVSWIFQSAEIERQDAERLLRQAVSVDPKLAEAHVRLGHVLGDRGRHVEAIDSLERGIGMASSPLVRYWGLCWLGRERREAGRLPAAIEAFGQAAALFPRAQTPRLGLSQLLYDRGDRARAAAEYGAAAEAQSDEDPRLEYEQTHVPSADALIAELRSAFGS